MPAVYNAQIYQGDDWIEPFTIYYADSITPIPLSAAKSQIRDAPGGTLIVEIDMTESDLPNGHVVMKLSQAQTAALAAGATYAMDVELTDTPTGEKHTYLKGVPTVEAQVTEDV